MNTRRYILFLIIAILTFLIGVAAATIFGGFGTKEAKHARCAYHNMRVEVEPPAPPVAPVAPVAPLPPLPAPQPLEVIALPRTAEIRATRGNQAPKAKSDEQSRGTVETTPPAKTR